MGRLAGEPDYRMLFLARSHACETMASYELEGLIEAALAETDDGRWLRRHVEFLFIPFVDKDGVEDGDQGKNRLPRDHNRDYDGQSIHDEIRALREFVPQWSRGRLRIGLALHCPTLRGTTNEYIYFVGSSDPGNAERTEDFARVLEAVQTGPLVYSTKNNMAYGQGWNAARSFAAGKPSGDWVRELPGVLIGGGIELPYANASGQAVTAESARAFGRDLAKAVRRYLAQEDERKP